MKNKVIIFRMTNACNLNCKYCYDKGNHTTVSQENEEFSLMIHNIIKNINKIWKNKDSSAEIIFHGGEPLIISVQNYKRLLDNIKMLYPKVKFSIQTNATLINQEYINLFKNYNVHIGISLDGFDEYTNKYRTYRNGTNSFNTVLKKIEMLNKNNVKFGIIMTINNNVINNESKLYKFIKDYKLNCNIRPAFKTSETEVDYMNNEEYYTFFKNLFNIWINDKDSGIKLHQIKELQDEFVKVLEPNYCNRSCSSSGNCFNNFISLDRYGNLYSCNRTYNNPEFFYGNLDNISIQEVDKKINSISKIRKTFIKNSKCKGCILYKECYGGCPANSFSIYRTIESIDDSFCESRIKIRMYIQNYLGENGIKKEYLEMREK